MSRLHPTAISRRTLLALIAGAGGSLLRPALGDEQQPSDRGIGGTGISSDPERTPRGIGFIGSIQRFGSIYVNNSRIAYPKDVEVRIDGRSATAAQLAVGQVVRTIAHEGGGGRLFTDRIEVVSEVIGAIASIADAEMIVMGQTVLLTDRTRPGWWQPGARVAVQGYRTPGGVIVATRIQSAGRRPDQIVGVPRLEGWNLQIGHLQLLGIGERYAGWRVIVRGRATGDHLRVSRVRIDAPFEGANIGSLSIETGIERGRLGSVHIGEAIRIDHLDAAIGPSSTIERAYLNLRLAPTGAVALDRLTMASGTVVDLGGLPPPGVAPEGSGRSGLGVGDRWVSGLPGAVGLGGPAIAPPLSSTSFGTPIGSESEERTMGSDRGSGRRSDDR